MFLAKLKSVTVLLCWVAALGLGTGGLCYLTRAGAADAPQEVESTRKREKTLLEALDKARKEAVMERERAEAERKRAEKLKEQFAEEKEAAKRAQQDAEKALYADRIRQAQLAFSSKPEEQQALNRLAELQAKVRDQFNRRRLALMEEMKKLEAEERETLAKLEAEARQMQRRTSSGGDKLDRILERLDRIERRLERLERGGRK